MLNKQKEKRPLLWMVLSVLVILLGIGLIVNSFVDARRELIQEHHSHLLDIAWSTDRSITNLLNRCQEELDYALFRSETDVRRYLQDGSTDAILKHLNRTPLVEGGYVSKLLVMDGEKMLLCVPEAGQGSRTFSFGGKEERTCLCTDADGEQYLAITSELPDSTVFFAALIDLNRFYQLVLSEKLSQDYWLGLYNESTHMVMQNDERHSLAMQMDPEEALTRKSGLSFLIHGEQESRILTNDYVLEDERYGFTEERQIAVLPTALNGNGVFCVAVSVESTHYFDLVRNLVWHILSYTLLILLAMCVMVSLLYRNRRKNDQIRDQVELLQAQNEATQALLEKTRELAHHQRLEMIGTMTSSIAHEFNNLLTPIMGYSLMTMEKLPEQNGELFDNVAEIYEASFRAKTLVSRLSALSRKNSEATSRLLCPDILVGKVRDVALPSVPRKVKVTAELGCPEPCLYGDETQLCQLILNIIINAFQAMEEKGGELFITTAIEDERVLLRFRDTGPGIPENVLEHIFEPFYTTKDMSRGTGLGLAIVKQTVESHNGELLVESAVGVGTIFSVWFPLQTEESS